MEKGEIQAELNMLMEFRGALREYVKTGNWNLLKVAPCILFIESKEAILLRESIYIEMKHTLKIGYEGLKKIYKKR